MTDFYLEIANLVLLYVAQKSEHIDIKHKMERKFIDLIDFIFDLIDMNLLSDEGCHCAEIISALGCYTVVTVVTVILMSVMNHDHIGEKAELT